MNKRGISAIVATVLIILIAVAGVAIIWFAVLPIVGIDMVGIDEAELSIVTVEGYTVWDEATKRLTVQVERGIGGDEPDAIDFIFVIDGTSVTERIYDVLEEGQTKRYYFDLDNYGKPSSVKLSFVYNNKTGSVLSEVENIPEGDLSEVEGEWDVVGSNLKFLGTGTVLWSLYELTDMTPYKNKIFAEEDIVTSIISSVGLRQTVPVEEYTLEFTSGIESGKRFKLITFVGIDNFNSADADWVTADCLFLDGDTDATAGDTFDIYGELFICGDGKCEYREGCTNCVEDCGKCDGETCEDDDDCKGGYCVHEICRSTEVHCGDFYCDAMENCSNCLVDCGECDYNDETCDATETCFTSPGACGKCSCGNEICDASSGENWDNCWTDCEYNPCGDGVCSDDENTVTCSQDCGEHYETDIYTDFSDWTTWDGVYHKVEDSGRTFLVSPEINVGNGNEQLHHWVTVDYSGTGRVRPIIGTTVSFNGDILPVMNVSSNSIEGDWVSNGEEMKISTPYRSREYSWVILETEGEVQIESVNHTYWVGYDTLYGHKPMEYYFANSYLPYRLMYPRNYDSSKSYPIVVSVPGSGGIGTNNIGQMEQVAFARYYFQDYFYDEEFEAFSIAPQAPQIGDDIIPYPYYNEGDRGEADGYYHSSAYVENSFYVEAITALVEDMIENPGMNIDEDRIYYTGFSYGGAAAYAISREAPDLWAAVWPVSGWPVGGAYKGYVEYDNLVPCEEIAEDPRGWTGCTSAFDEGELMQEKIAEEAEIYKNIPFRIGSGAFDGMSYGGELACRAINAAGGNCIHDVIPGATHQVSGAIYGNREYVGWLFNQRKG